MTELVDVLVMNKRPRPDDSEVRMVGVFAVKHVIQYCHLARGMLDPIAQVVRPRRAFSNRNGGNPLSTSMQRTITHNVRLRSLDTPIRCGVLVAPSSGVMPVSRQ